MSMFIEHRQSGQGQIIQIPFQEWKDCVFQFRRFHHDLLNCPSDITGINHSWSMPVQMTTLSYHKKNSFLSQSSFWMFTVHYTFVVFFREALFLDFSSLSSFFQMVLYSLFVLLVIAISILTFSLMNIICPRFVSFSTGDRNNNLKSFWLND